MRRPGLDEFKRHAEKFGVAGVLDTAIDVGYGREQLIDLLPALDAIEAAQFADKRERKRLGLIGVAPRHRSDIATRVDRAIADNTFYRTGARS